MKLTLALLAALLVVPATALDAVEKPPQFIASLIERNCFECHNAATTEGKLDLTAVPFDLANPNGIERWVQIFDRVEKKEMPPDSEDMKPEDRKALLAALESSLHAASSVATVQKGRGPRCGSNMGDVNIHDNTNLPILFAGGGLQHGQHLAYNRDRNKPLCNLFVTILQNMGTETDTFRSSA